MPAAEETNVSNEAPTELTNPVLKDDDATRAMNTFRSELAKAEAEQKGEHAPEPDKTPPQEEKTPTEAPKNETGIPDEFLTGEPPKKEEKVDDAVAQIEAMVLPPNAKKEQVASFAKLKEQSVTAIKAAHARVAELEAKTSDGSTKAEIEAAREEAKKAAERAAELEHKLEMAAFEKSPKFQQQYVEAEKGTLDGAKTYLEGTEIDPAVIEVAARLKGSARIKVLQDAGMDPSTLSAVTPYLAEYDKIQRGKASALENWKVQADAEALQQKQALDAKAAQRAQEENRIWDSTLQKISVQILPFRKVENNENWNKQGDTLLADAKRVYNGEADLAEVAEKVAMGTAYPVLQKMYDTVVQKNKDLAAENAKLKSARPGASSGSDLIGSASNGTYATEAERQMATFRRNLEVAKTGG